MPFSITLNVNVLNFPIKRPDQQTELKNKTQSFIAYKKCTSLTKKSKHKLKVKERKNIFQANGA
jgi:hypothetical protein